MWVLGIDSYCWIRRFTSAGCQIGCKVFRHQLFRIAILVKVNKLKSGSELSADLLFKGVAEHQRLARLLELLDFGLGQMRLVRIRQSMTHLQLPLLNCIFIEDECHGFQEAREQASSCLQDTEALTPDRLNLRNKTVRTGMNDQVKGLPT